ASDAAFDAGAHIARQLVEMQQRFRVHADHAVDDEFKTRKADASVGIGLEIESAIGIADVHHDLERQLRHFFKIVGGDVEIELAVVDDAGVTLSATHRHVHAGLQHFGGVSATDHGGNTEFARDDCS